MSTRKKIIVSIISIVIILGVILFIYAFFDSRTNDRTLTQSIRNIFPTSSRVNLPNTQDPNQNNTSTNVHNTSSTIIPNISGKLRQISNKPVSGGIFSSSSTVRFIEKATGNIYEYSYFNNSLQKITHTTIPKLFDSYWINKNSFVARYIGGNGETIKSFIGTILNPGDQGRVSTEFLPDNILSVAVDGNRLFYIVDNISGSIGFIYDENTKFVQIFSSKLRELTALWHNNKPFVYTNPSNNVPGTLFEIKNGTFIEIIRDVPGLMVNSVGRELLISQFETKSATFNYDIETNTFEPFRSAVIPEKCIILVDDLYCAVSSIPRNFPDSWYIGLAEFTDNLNRVDREGGNVELYDFANDIPEGIDVINIQKSPDEELILFTNKKDGTLWSLEV